MKKVLVVWIIVTLAAASAGCIAWRDTEELPRPPKVAVDLHAASHGAEALTSTDAGPPCDTCETGLVLQRPERVPLPKDRFVIFLFHSERPCSCGEAIAAGAGKAISENFADRVKAGTLECTALDVEDEANAHYADKYALAPVDHLHNGLVIVEMKDNQPGRWKKLTRANELKDKPEYPAYVKSEIEAFIKGAAAGNK